MIPRLVHPTGQNFHNLRALLLMKKERERRIVFLALHLMLLRTNSIKIPSTNLEILTNLAFWKLTTSSPYQKKIVIEQTFGAYAMNISFFVKIELFPCFRFN